MATDSPTTTRRRLLGLFAAAAPAIALSGTASALPMSQNERFVLAMAAIHPNGRRAAEHALAAGMKPDDLSTVLTALGNNRTGDNVPALLFEFGNEYRVFRPHGEDRRG